MSAHEECSYRHHVRREVLHVRFAWEIQAPPYQRLVRIPFHDPLTLEKFPSSLRIGLQYTLRRIRDGFRLDRAEEVREEVGGCVHDVADEGGYGGDSGDGREVCVEGESGGGGGADGGDGHELQADGVLSVMGERL